MQTAGTLVEAASASAVDGKAELRSAGEDLREPATDAEDTPPSGVEATERPHFRIADTVATGTEKSAGDERDASGVARKGTTTQLQGRARTGSVCWSDKLGSAQKMHRVNPLVLNETMAAFASCQGLRLGRVNRDPFPPFSRLDAVGRREDTGGEGSGRSKLSSINSISSIEGDAEGAGADASSDDGEWSDSDEDDAEGRPDGKNTKRARTAP